ncbi:hypothetical protein F4803DRAFT_411773 [Xylaria telfairii]|nr:hypothetical protein F4803DRAFT_411773 [Xylaria telfairii]
MASPPNSTQRTRRPSLDVQFNAALLDFAPRYMKDQLEQLARECDQRLERQLLPRLHALLLEIDHERDAFQEQKRNAVSRLREHLHLLSLDAAVVDDAMGRLHAIAPRYLALIPTASSLPLDACNSASASASSTAASSDAVFGTPDGDTGSQAPVSPRSTPDSTTHANPWTTPTKSSGHESEIHAQALADGSTVPSPLKRPAVDDHNESDVSSKRQRTANEKALGVAHPQMDRRVAFPNLEIGECIFRHAERKGFFIVRCDYCEKGFFFTEAPLRYNRALKHFQKHDQAVSDQEELTNEYIFEKFAFQVDGDEMASKYWIREHLTETPHTFVPVRSPGDTSQAYDAEDMVRRHQEIEDDFSPPFPKLRESLRSRQSDREPEHEKPRRARRNVPRPDYAEMVANKDPWNASEAEIEVKNIQGS